MTVVGMLMNFQFVGFITFVIQILINFFLRITHFEEI